jgi:hypothetical protein
MKYLLVVFAILLLFSCASGELQSVHGTVMRTDLIFHMPRNLYLCFVETRSGEVFAFSSETMWSTLKINDSVEVTYSTPKNRGYSAIYQGLQVIRPRTFGFAKKY